MRTSRVGLLPAAGVASRMNGAPKFLFPSREPGSSLLQRHIHHLSQHVDKIVVGHRKETTPFIQISNQSKQLVTMEVHSASMVDTVIQMVSANPADAYIMGMPDTDFIGSNPYEDLARLEEEAGIAYWRSREAQVQKSGMIKLDGRYLSDLVDKPKLTKFRYLWGALAFGKNTVSSMNAEMPSLSEWLLELISTGKKIEGFYQPGEYFDCGTHEEYLEYLRFTE
jgi:hypothetical protein